MNFNKGYVLAVTENLLKTDSPTGFTGAVAALAMKYLSQLGYASVKTNNGGVFAFVKGRDSSKTVGLSAHLDTLGLMVRSVKPSGKLALTNVGSPTLPTLDGEYCKVYARDGRVYTGTILCTSPSSHVYSDTADKPRKIENLEVRLDETVKNAGDVEKLGITAGAFVCYDPKTVITPSGYIKSRFLDDKLSAGILFGVLQYLKENDVKPRHDTYFMFSVYEEVGHGMSYIPAEISELLAVDMGCIGEDLTCTEHDVSICVKDSSGPYDYDMTTRLINLAKESKLSYAADIYPRYGSDVGAANVAGANIAGALIGPGVHASHGMERSHYEAAENAMKLIALYLGV